MTQPKPLVAIFKILVFGLGLLGLIRGMDIALSTAYSAPRIMLHDLREHAETGGVEQIFVGTSRIFRDINPAIVTTNTGVVSFDLSTSQQSMQGSYFLLAQAYKELPDPPKRVVLEIGWNRLYREPVQNADWIVYDAYPEGTLKAQYFFSAFTADNKLKTLFPSLRSNNREKLIAPETNALQTITKNIQNKQTPDYLAYHPRFGYPTSYPRYLKDGYVYGLYEYPPGEKGKPLLVHWSREREILDANNLKFFEKIINLCRSNGSEVVLIVPPRPVAQMAYCDNVQDYLDFMTEKAAAWNVPLYNFELVKTEKFAGTDDQFMDYRHLSGSGAETFSRLISDFMRQHDAGTLDPKDWFYPDYQSVLAAKQEVYTCWIKGVAGMSGAYDARVLTGSNVAVEYKWTQTIADGEVTLADYNPNPRIRLNRRTGVLRLYVRKVGTDVPYDHTITRDFGG